MSCVIIIMYVVCGSDFIAEQQGACVFFEKKSLMKNTVVNYCSKIVCKNCGQQAFLGAM